MTDEADPLSKVALRAKAKAGRAVAAAAAPKAGARAAEVFMAQLAPRLALAPGLVVAGYRPIGSELDPDPLISTLSAHGACLCLPVVVEKGAPLGFRAWSPGEALAMGAFGAEIPAEGEALTPSVLITPLLAFDRCGGRLGYGGGFYDRTLQALRAGDGCTAIGLAYAAQEIDAAPQEPTDQPLDAVVTETEAIFFPR